MYGAEYWDRLATQSNDWNHHINLQPVPHLTWLMRLRRTHAHGPQHDFIQYDDPFSSPPRANKDPNLIGWTREGIEDIENTGLACLLSKEGSCKKWMYVGKRHAGREWKHYVDNHVVRINGDGWGEFDVWPGQMAVFIPA